MSRSPLILVIEDNLTNQLLTLCVLDREGFRVDLAGTPFEARERLQVRLPDLILMDIQLPGQDGLHFTRELKADSSTASIPIVALTAHAMGGDKERAMAVGCTGYISKPIDTRTFGAEVREFLGRASSQPALTGASGQH